MKLTVYCCMVLMLATAVPAMAIVQHTVTDVGTLGGSESGAYGIDDSGLVVDWADTPPTDTPTSLYEYRDTFEYRNTPLYSAGALTFNFTPAQGMSQQAIDAFARAGARWSALFNDPVTVNINIDFRSLGSGILGQSSASEYYGPYSGFRQALLDDKTSDYDDTATSHLAAGPFFPMLINRTSNSPYGAGSATPYLDNNNNQNNYYITTTSANLKALGLLPGDYANSDAAISFSTNYQWDFNPDDGITPGTFDFVGIATHEIGHALGFISGVDVLDYNSTSPNFYPDYLFDYVSLLDLYRYSTTSVGLGVIDWTADNRPKYFSIDGGATNPGDYFSTGVVWGDGRQASHWKDSLGLGIMDPTAGSGEMLAITDLDVEGMDVIGWDQTPIVPEPPIASFIALEDNVCPLLWYFTDTSSPGGGIDDWLWDFGDEEGASEEQNPSYQYTGPGDYYVELAVSGPGGSSAWGQWIHVVPEPGTLALIAPALLAFAGITFRRMRK